MKTNTLISLNKIAKVYRGQNVETYALKDISLNINQGDYICISGPSGCGKSTLLKIMAGLDKDFQGEAWAAEGAKVGYLPQEPVLDPTLDVRGNVMLGVKAKKDVQVFSLDTGRLHPETYRFIDTVRKHYNIKIDVMSPDAEKLEAFKERNETSRLWVSEAQMRIEEGHYHPTWKNIIAFWEAK